MRPEEAFSQGSLGLRRHGLFHLDDPRRTAAIFEERADMVFKGQGQRNSITAKGDRGYAAKGFDAQHVAVGHADLVVRSGDAIEGFAVRLEVALHLPRFNPVQLIGGAVAEACDVGVAGAMQQGIKGKGFAQLSGTGPLVRLTVDQAVGGVISQGACLLYTSPSPRDGLLSRMPSSA